MDQPTVGSSRALVLLGLFSVVAFQVFYPPTDACAQAVPSPDNTNADFIATWRWRNIGPNRGGRSIAAAGSVSRPLEYYFGATGGGLWKTTDGGTTWDPVSDGHFRSASVGSIGICEADPDMVYAGTGEGQFRAQMSAGDGVYGTRDGGRTWQHLGLESSTGQTAVARVRVDPGDCDLVYAAVLGDPYGPNEERGVYRSRDGGRNWERVLFRSNGAGASDLMLDPSDPRTIYVTIWDVVRPPWGGRTGDGSGIFKSTDGGDTWTELTQNPGLPDVKIGKTAISVSGADPNRVYLNVEATPGYGGIYRSDDAGATWVLASGQHELFHRAEYYTRIVADPQNRDRVYVLNKNFFRSDDGGETYSRMRVPHGDNHDMWIAPDDNQRMVQSNDGGGNVSFNGGRTWTDQDFVTSQIYHVFATDDFPYLVCGAQQDNTSKCVPSDGNGSFWYQGPGGEQGYVAVNPKNTRIGFGGSQRGGLTRFDRSTGQRQSVQIWPMMADGWPAGMQRERFQWTFPIVMSPHDPNTVYATSQHVWRSTNGGHSWERISPDLTRAEPHTLTGSEQPVKDHSGTDFYATVFTLAPSPHDPQTIWAGSDDGLIHITRDGGANWEDITPQDLPEFTKASLIEVSPHSPGKAYLAAERYKLQDVAPYIFRTEDYGRSWTKIVSGILPGHFVRAVKEDPIRSGLLFAGTEHGPYVSFNDGTNWQSLALNLPDLQVPDLEVKDNDLVVATFGRGIFILDDISPLRAFSDEILGRPAFLFEPADAIRTRSGPAEGVGGRLYGRTRIPGANQVSVYYHLSDPAQQVTIEFLDSRGRTIRSFTGTPGAQPREMVTNSVGFVINGPSWGSSSPAPLVETDAGLHHFQWEMRYPPATDFVGLRLRSGNANGPIVVPGDYRVRLTVDGRSQEHAFRVDKDPRLTDVTQDDLEAQLALDMRVHTRFDDATSAVVSIRELKGQIDDRILQAGDRRITSTGETLKQSLSQIEAEIYQVNAAAQSDIKHFGSMITNRLAHLGSTLRSADARPTEQTYAVFTEVSAQLDAQLARLEELLTTELTRLNEMLEDRGLPPVGRRVDVITL